MSRIFVAAIIGPTASGKTALAIETAKRFSGEIISADSMQIYRGMDIATAAPTESEQAAVRHHLIKIMDPSEQFSVAKYKTLASQAISDVNSRSLMPVVCGGTGQYIDALLNNIVFSPVKTDENLRHHLNSLAEIYGGAMLLSLLSSIDAEAAAALHENDTKRIVRALEHFCLTGETITSQKQKSRLEPSPYDVCYIGLTAKNRQFLYDRINLRVDKMLELGLVEEAQAFYSNPNAATAKQAIGYKELKPYLDGELTLEQAVENLKTETRRYAKRQLTWFRRNEEINWLEIDTLNSFQLADEAEKIIRKRLGEAKKGE